MGEDNRRRRSCISVTKIMHVQRKSDSQHLALPKISNPRLRLGSLNSSLDCTEFSSPIQKSCAEGYIMLGQVPTIKEGIDRIIEECDNYDPISKTILMNEITKSEAEIKEVMKELKKLDLPDIRKKWKKKNPNEVCIKRKDMKKIIAGLRREIKLGYE
ncbi:unnamed protein product [Blepharisma stoltei]|uniref:Uncharacterized protein n=1 Tax=Blepharisma stoltei TaxID=1481888 RepID=A0AAU9IQS9_9CILI|nr:unnamed protein product [Blepharisma stoltei]